MKHVEALLAQTKKKVAELDITVKPTSATVTIDGAQIDRDTSGSVFVEPGSHSLEASADGYDTLSKTVNVAKGSKQAVSLELAKTAAADPHAASVGAMPTSGLSNTTAPAPKPGHDAPAVPPDTTKPPLWPVWVGSGVAVVGLGMGIGFTLAAGSKRSDADALAASLKNQGGQTACAPGTPYAGQCADYRHDEDSVRTDQNVALAGFIAGGVGAAFTVGYLIWRGGESSSDTAGFLVRPQLAVARSGARFSVEGRF